MSSTPEPLPPIPPGRERWLLLTLAGVQFTHIVDFMIMMPLGPQLTQVFGLSAAQFGLLVSSYNLAAGVSGFLAAFYIDRFDRRRLLLGLYALFAMATLACGLAPTFAALLLARVAAGVFGGVLGTLVHTIVGDVVPFERRGRAMAVVMTAFSVATVAGVPAGLFLAAHWNWHIPFVALALVCAVLLAGAWATLPSLQTHLHAQMGSTWSRLREVLGLADHWRAFAFSVLLVFAGFVVIPYITLYTTSYHRAGDGGLPLDQVPTVYLAGGLATLFTARWIGRWVDRAGKVEVFQRMALLTTVPLVLMTQVAPLGMAFILPVSTLFFVCMSGRMIPGMAILTSACAPRLRGMFMALNGSVQALAMGLAAWIGGLLIGQDPQGRVVHYGFNALLAVVASLLAVWMVGRLRLHGAHPTGPVRQTEAGG